jgi:hypothetical protein
VYAYSALRRERDAEGKRDIAVSRLVSVSEEVLALFLKYAT